MSCTFCSIFTSVISRKGNLTILTNTPSKMKLVGKERLTSGQHAKTMRTANVRTLKTTCNSVKNLLSTTVPSQLRSSVFSSTLENLVTSRVHLASLHMRLSFRLCVVYSVNHCCCYCCCLNLFLA